MKNQRNNYSIFEVSLFVLSCVIIGIGVYGCKDSELSTEQSHKTVFEGEETSTAGGEPIIVDTEVVWRIVEPEDFLKAFEKFRFANAEEEFLRSRVRNTSDNVIGRHYLSEYFRFQDEEELVRYVVNEDGIISSESSVSKFSLIQDEMLAMLRQDVSDAGCGIEIEQVIIKRIRFSEDVQENARRTLENIERQQREAEERARQQQQQQAERE